MYQGFAKFPEKQKREGKIKLATQNPSDSRKTMSKHYVDKREVAEQMVKKWLPNF